MSSNITTPKNNVPVGRVSIGGQTYDVAQHPEFVRFFFDLFRRVGGTGGSSNTDLQSSIDELTSEIGFLPPRVPQMPLPDDLQPRYEPLPGPDDLSSARMEALEAEVARMGRLINDLQSSYHL
jgi:hypothetical protein